TKVVSVDVVTEWESGQDAQGLVTPTDDEGDDKKDDKVSPPVSTDPMHDGKAHEYGHRNERHEALQMGVVQQPGGTHEHVKNNENPKQSIRYSRLIAHGCCLAFQSTLVTVAVISLAIVPAASIAGSGDHLYRINPQRGNKSYPKKFMRSVSTQAVLFRLRLLALLETVAVGVLISPAEGFPAYRPCQ